MAFCDILIKWAVRDRFTLQVQGLINQVNQMLKLKR